MSSQDSATCVAPGAAAAVVATIWPSRGAKRHGATAASAPQAARAVRTLGAAGIPAPARAGRAATSKGATCVAARAGRAATGKSTTSVAARAGRAATGKGTTSVAARPGQGAGQCTAIQNTTTGVASDTGAATTAVASTWPSRGAARRRAPAGCVPLSARVRLDSGAAGIRGPAGAGRSPRKGATSAAARPGRGAWQCTSRQAATAIPISGTGAATAEVATAWPSHGDERHGATACARWLLPGAASVHGHAGAARAAAREGAATAAGQG
mmetsp:Transcript_88720/g.276124  ORF Transcript_88720/g.276124 Transcript_88720/m.276124 type:complete len:269 (+) Transcript_88720:3-809(+)